MAEEGEGEGGGGGGGGGAGRRGSSFHYEVWVNG